MSERILPNKIKDTNVVNRSTRHGARIQLIVIHDTEGANIPNSNADLLGLVAYFDRSSTQASAHVATDGDGNSVRMVDDSEKAWHCSYYNPVSLGVEQVHKHPDKWTSAQIDETARWVALWSRRWDIPIRTGRVTKDGRVALSGVVTHRSLGNIGGGHVDPIDKFPWNKMLERARHFRREQEQNAN